MENDNKKEQSENTTVRVPIALDPELYEAVNDFMKKDNRNTLSGTLLHLVKIALPIANKKINELQSLLV